MLQACLGLPLMQLDCTAVSTVLRFLHGVTNGENAGAGGGAAGVKAKTTQAVPARHLHPAAIKQQCLLLVCAGSMVCSMPTGSRGQLISCGVALWQGPTPVALLACIMLLQIRCTPRLHHMSHPHPLYCCLQIVFPLRPGNSQPTVALQASQFEVAVTVFSGQGAGAA